MSSQIDKKTPGYAINWSGESDGEGDPNQELSSPYLKLKKDLSDRYPNFEPLQVFMAHFESSFIENNQLTTYASEDAFAMLQDLEEICWALDLQMASERSR